MLFFSNHCARGVKSTFVASMRATAKNYECNHELIRYAEKLFSLLFLILCFVSSTLALEIYINGIPGQVLLSRSSVSFHCLLLCFLMKFFGEILSSSAARRYLIVGSRERERIASILWRLAERTNAYWE